VDDTTGDDINLSTATIIFAIRDPFDCELFSKGTVTVPSTGFFTVSFTRDQLKDLSGTYDVGCTIEISGVTTQFVVGRLPVVDGAVPQ